MTKKAKLVCENKFNSGRKVGEYKGKLFRSVYEYYYYKHLEDQGVNLQKVKYEQIVIPYKLRGKSRNYYPDFLIEELNMIVEIKSSYALYKRKKGRAIIEAKKIAAEKYCKEHGLTYAILTEKDFPVKSYKDAYEDKNIVWIRK